MKLSKKLFSLSALTIIIATVRADACQECKHLLKEGYCALVAKKFENHIERMTHRYALALKEKILPAGYNKIANDLKEYDQIVKTFKAITTKDPNILLKHSYQFIDQLWKIAFLANNLKPDGCICPKKLAKRKKEIINQALFITFGANELKNKKYHPAGKTIIKARGLLLIEAMCGKAPDDKKE